LDESPAEILLNYNVYNKKCNTNFLNLIQLIMSVLLHGLYTNQSVQGIITLYECCTLIVKKFGFQLFIAGAKDSLQVFICSIQNFQFFQFLNFFRSLLFQFLL
jgi:hypothetical protein